MYELHTIYWIGGTLVAVSGLILISMLRTHFWQCQDHIEDHCARQIP